MLWLGSSSCRCDHNIPEGGVILISRYVVFTTFFHALFTYKMHYLSLGVTTVELDELAAQTAASLSTKHPEWSLLAARISVSNLHKQTSKVFSDVVEILHKNIHPKTKSASPLVSDELHKIVLENKDRLNSAIIYDRDYNYDYFGFKTLE